MSTQLKSPRRNFILLTCLAIEEYFCLAIVLTTLAPFFLDKINGLFLTTPVPLATRLELLGFTLAVAPLGQLLGAGLLGELSDQFGRKKLLLLTLAGTVMATLMCALSVEHRSFIGLLGARFLTGLLAGNIAIAQASIADVTTPENKIKHLNYLGIGVGLGMLIGPIVGSHLLGNQPVLNFANAFYANLMVSLIMLLGIFWGYEETLVVKKARVFCWYQGPKLLVDACLAKPIRNLLLFWAVFILGWNFYLQFFTNFLQDAIRLTPHQIGNVYAYMGVIFLLYQFLIIQPLAKKMVTKKTVILLSTALAVGIFLLLMGLAQSQKMVLWGLTGYMLAMSLFMANFNALLSDQATRFAQGSVFGMAASIQAGSAVMISIVGGYLLYYSPRSPLIGAGLIILFSIILLIYALKRRPSK